MTSVRKLFDGQVLNGFGPLPARRTVRLKDGNVEDACFDQWLRFVLTIDVFIGASQLVNGIRATACLFNQLPRKTVGVPLPGSNSASRRDQRIVRLNGRSHTGNRTVLPK